MQEGLTLEGRISAAIEPSLSQLGFDLVKAQLIGGDGRNILQILIERKDGERLGITDCTKASRQISAILDVEDVISDKYNLEVSSPGIDRPLIKLKDFESHTDYEIKLETIEKVTGQRKFRGMLLEVEGNVITIAPNIVPMDKPNDADTVKIDFDNIKSAKLILNDELLKMAQK